MSREKFAECGQRGSMHSATASIASSFPNTDRTPQENFSTSVFRGGARSIRLDGVRPGAGVDSEDFVTTRLFPDGTVLA